MPKVFYKTGVYCIRNLMNNKRYVGSAAVSFGDRWSCHRSTLNKNKHHSPKLQAAWNKWGATNFVFEVLLRCHPNVCIVEEQRFINKFDSAHYLNGYNVAPKAGSSSGIPCPLNTRLAVADANRKRVVSDETRQRMSKAATGRKHGARAKQKCRLAALSRTKEAQAKITASLTGRPVSAETRKKMAITKTGKITSESTKLKLSIAGTGRVHTEETKRKIGLVHRGKTVSEATRRKISEAARRHHAQSNN